MIKFVIYTGKIGMDNNAVKKKHKRKPLTKVNMLHYFRLFLRSAIWIYLIVKYIIYRVHGGTDIGTFFYTTPALMIAIYAVFVLEMIMRFFPSNLESPGCQKQFRRNYIKTGNTNIDVQDNNAVVLVAIIWVALNGIFGFLRLTGVFDDGIMILICGAYAVSDIICILFFCPFQSWFLKNKCCCSCRIYNWDYAMMFTPIVFVQNIKFWYLWILLVMSIMLAVRWEVTFFLHPERFAESTNAYLSCSNCTEKLCMHKNQLKSLWKHISEYSQERVRRLK